MINVFRILKSCLPVSLAALSLTLSGCIADEMMADEDYRFSPIQASQRYPIKTHSGVQTISISSHLGSLSRNQINALNSYAYAARAARAKHVTISRPIAGGKSERVAGQIANLLVSQGIAYKSLQFAGYKGAASGPVHLGYDGDHLVTKPCGDWSKDLSDTLDNTPYPNLGCAVQANIAAEIVNPDSLTDPLTSDMAPAAQGVLAVNNVMSGAVKPALPTN